MSNHEIPAEYVPGAQVIISLAYGALVKGTVTKRTKTQITTESENGRVERWVAGWSAQMHGDLQPYGTLHSYGRHDRLMLAGSRAAGAEQSRRDETAKAGAFTAALAAATREGGVEELEALMALLPERIERAKAAEAKSEKMRAELEAEQARFAARQAAYAASMA